MQAAGANSVLSEFRNPQRALRGRYAFRCENFHVRSVPVSGLYKAVIVILKFPVATDTVGLCLQE